MSTSIKLPTGQQVTRYWNGHGFLYMFAGTDATIDHNDLVALAATWLADDMATPEVITDGAATLELGVVRYDRVSRYPTTMTECPERSHGGYRVKCLRPVGHEGAHLALVEDFEPVVWTS